MCMCVCIASVCHTCAGDFGETNDSKSLGAEVTGGFELPDTAASKEPYFDLQEQHKILMTSHMPESYFSNLYCFLNSVKGNKI